MFFSSLVETIGDNNSYFIDSFSIGIGNWDTDISTFNDGESIALNPKIPAESLNDYILFGNDSDCSDFEDIEAISKDLNMVPSKPISKRLPNEITAAICFLKKEELICELNGNVSIFCIRRFETGLSILLSTYGKNSIKLQVKEGDVVIIITKEVTKAEVYETFKKSMNKITEEKIMKYFINEIITKFNNEINMTVITAKIMKRI